MASTHHNAARFVITTLLLSAAAASAQMSPPRGPLDPTRSAHLKPAPVSHITAQFIWTPNDAAAHDPALQARVRGQNDKTAPHYFRAQFLISSRPQQATLYIAGPRSATVFLNGQQVLRATDDGTRPKNLSVITADVSSALRPGDNVLAIQEVRGHSSLHTGASPTINQITYGEVLAAEILPAPVAVDAAPILVTNNQWRSTLKAPPNWELPSFNDSDWPHVESLGIIGSRPDFLQWNADAGLYAWPGYSGISPRLQVFTIAPVTKTNYENSLLLDFGREISGRVRLTSTADHTIAATISYGESPEEALKDKSYLGTRSITVPPHASAFGPKSGFRYVKLTLPPGSPRITPTVQAISFPVQYLGSFQSSDPTLNRIWETAAYTARLNMQEGIWDGIKRDRGRWMGDLDVTARTLSTVFASPPVNALLERTMTDIIGPPPVTRDVNTIAGYSALWITGQASFYRRTGDLAYLRRIAPTLRSLLAYMDTELDANGLFDNHLHHKVFVDWSEGFNTDTPEARAATDLEFVLAYREGGWLLNEAGDTATATRYFAQQRNMVEAARRAFTQRDNTFGPRWQTNAMAVVSGVATPQQSDAIWQRVLSRVGDPTAVVTPYYGFYILEAMAALDHRREALDWMRAYWGGMLAEGATSFWEAYDPHWPKDDFHAHLQADNKTGYYVSLAHGWSSGPAAWLSEQILGIQPVGRGFHEVNIRPQLPGLSYARGAVPTPSGLLRIDARPTRLVVMLPSNVFARVTPPFHATRMNGKPLTTQTVELSAPGTYTFIGTSPAQ